MKTIMKIQKAGLRPCETVVFCQCGSHQLNLAVGEARLVDREGRAEERGQNVPGCGGTEVFTTGVSK